MGFSACYRQSKNNDMKEKKSDTNLLLGDPETRMCEMPTNETKVTRQETDDLSEKQIKVIPFCI